MCLRLQHMVAEVKDCDELTLTWGEIEPREKVTIAYFYPFVFLSLRMRCRNSDDIDFRAIKEMSLSKKMNTIAHSNCRDDATVRSIISKPVTNEHIRAA